MHPKNNHHAILFLFLSLILTCTLQNNNLRNRDSKVVPCKALIATLIFLQGVINDNSTLIRLLGETVIIAAYIKTKLLSFPIESTNNNIFLIEF